MKLLMFVLASMIGFTGASCWADVCGKIQKFEAQGGNYFIVTFDSGKSIPALVEPSILASALTTVTPNITLCFRQSPHNSVYDFISASK